MTITTLAFDTQIERWQNHGGISRYFRDLKEGLSHQKTIKIVEPAEADMLHASFYAGWPKKMRHQLLVSSLYDMTPELYAEKFPLGLLRQKLRLGPHKNKKAWLRASDAIISISKSSANDLKRLWPKVQTAIHVIHLGTNMSVIQPRPLPALVGRRFWLIVGKRYSYKNGITLLKAMRCVTDRINPPLLVATGGGPWSHEETKLIRELRLGDLVTQVQAIDGELAWLYRNSEAVFIPSVAEGFSLPLIESLSCNTPCIASDIPVHAEVGGEFAQLIPGDSVEPWMDMLAAISASPLQRPKTLLGEEAWSRLTDHYSLKKMTERHVEFYQALRCKKGSP